MLFFREPEFLFFFFFFCLFSEVWRSGFFVFFLPCCCLERDLLYLKSKLHNFIDDLFCTGTVLKLHDLESTITVREVEPKAGSDVLGVLGDDLKDLGPVHRLVWNVDAKDGVTNVLGATAGSRHFFFSRRSKIKK